jgi:hypothetical protein
MPPNWFNWPPGACESARVIATQHIDEIDQRIADLQRMRDSLAELVATCQLPVAIGAVRCCKPCRMRRPAHDSGDNPARARLPQRHGPTAAAHSSAGGPGRRRSRATTDQQPASRTAAGVAGSPTLLVDGTDPFTVPGQAPSVSCRLYRDESGRLTGTHP